MIKFGLALIVGLGASVSAFAGPVDFCARYAKKPVADKLIRSLADKLQYSYEAFCTADRIMDVFQEDKLVYHKETDSFQPYIFVTIHYNEYSCEYQFNLQQDRWAKQECYNTF